MVWGFRRFEGFFIICWDARWFILGSEDVFWLRVFVRNGLRVFCSFLLFGFWC